MYFDLLLQPPELLSLVLEHSLFPLKELVILVHVRLEILEFSMLLFETHVPHCVHGAVQEALTVEPREVVDLVLRKELTEVVHLDAELSDLLLDLPDACLLAVDCPDALVVPVELSEDDDVFLVGVEQLHLDGGNLLAHADKVDDAGGSSQDAWLPSQSEADTVNNCGFSRTVGA